MFHRFRGWYFDPEVVSEPEENIHLCGAREQAIADGRQDIQADLCWYISCALVLAVCCMGWDCGGPNIEEPLLAQHNTAIEEAQHMSLPNEDDLDL